MVFIAVIELPHVNISVGGAVVGFSRHRKSGFTMKRLMPRHFSSVK